MHTDPELLGPHAARNRFTGPGFVPDVLPRATELTYRIWDLILVLGLAWRVFLVIPNSIPPLWR
jgi:hypothetical protein